jgi:hypothetical protein
MLPVFAAGLLLMKASETPSADSDASQKGPIVDSQGDTQDDLYNKIQEDQNNHAQ